MSWDQEFRDRKSKGITGENKKIYALVTYLDCKYLSSEDWISLYEWRGSQYQGSNQAVLILACQIPKLTYITGLNSPILVAR